jgi:hypothetical protein
MVGEPVVCPPHHWEVVSRQVERALCYHHACLQCGLEKDVAVAATMVSRLTGRRASPGPQVGLFGTLPATR